MPGFSERRSKGIRICINGEEASDANEGQIRHFIQCLDMEMKISLYEFLKNTDAPKFKLWLRLLSEEIQKTDTESRFPITREEAVSIILKIMRAYSQLPENEKKILWEMFESKEVQMTLRDLHMNAVKVIALNKALHDVDSADGAVELLKLTEKREDDRKELVFAGIDFILKNRVGNPEAAFRLLKLIGENTELRESEKQRISKFLGMLDPDFILIKMGEVPNNEIKKLITEKLYYAVSKLGWVPKNHRVRETSEHPGLIRKK